MDGIGRSPGGLKYRAAYAANEYKPAATAEVAISRHIPLVSAGAENAIGFVESTFLKANIYFHIKK